MSSKRIILYDKSDIIRLGFERLFSQQNNVIEIVKSVYDDEQLTNAINSYNPDVVLINPALTGTSTINLINHIRRQWPAVYLVALVYSYVERNTLAAFDDIIEINDTLTNITKLLLNANSLQEDNSASGAETEELSARESDIVALVAKGLTNKEIAEQLNISVHTVITHRKNISKKTGIKSISGLTMYAILNKLI